jgi:uncharacterized lipoprotein YddW (UPF0748 family)
LKFLCALTLCLGVSAVGFTFEPKSHQDTEKGPIQEVRALWIVRTTLTSPEKIRQMVDAAAANGFNTLIVQIRGRGDAYYKSRVEPRASELKDQSSALSGLATLVADGHSRRCVSDGIHHGYGSLPETD